MWIVLGRYFYHLLGICHHFGQVIQHLVIDRYRGEPKPDLNLVPRESRDEMWLPLYCFDISPDGKNGCILTETSLSHLVWIPRAANVLRKSSLGCGLYLCSLRWVYPQNAQFSAHIKEFMTGYRISADAVQIKFPTVDSTRAILDFTVGYNDGQLKCLTMIALISFVHELDTWSQNLMILCYPTQFCVTQSKVLVVWTDLFLLGSIRTQPCIFSKDFQPDDLADPMIDHMLQSFRFVRCAYKHFDVPSHHFLHALRLLVLSTIIGFGSYSLLYQVI